MGIPGMHDETEGEMQQAPHPMRQIRLCESVSVFIRINGLCRVEFKELPVDEIKHLKDCEFLLFK